MIARLKRGILAVLMVVAVAAAQALALDGQWRVAVSSDGVPIAYSVCGGGDTTLIFVHGWSCDSRYWREQVPFFERRYQVVTVDLAGHGHSGTGRKTYTMRSFGEDVKAVADALGVKRAILIGHSMAGIVVAEAAELMPGRVLGIVGVDTLANVEAPMTQEQIDGYAAAFEKDFPAATAPFVRSMFAKNIDPALAEWIVADMSAAPPAAAISALREMSGMYVRGDVARLFDGLNVPVRCVNADLWPTDVAANRRHMRSFDVKLLKGRGHFLMLESPKEFNRLLEQTVKELAAGK